MPHNKKHHYVPRFYLKRFSPNGRSINLWNIKNERKILSANLKHQCYKNYFYGKELEVEKALGVVEGQSSHIFRLIDKFQAPPPHGSDDYLTLVIYMLMQHGRTAYSADSLDEMSDKLIKHLMGPKAKEDGIDLSKITIGIKESAQYSLGITTQMYPLMLDLDCKLLLNETNVEFVTSDNPVVLYNQLLSFRKYGSNTGLASKGLQVFLPINSNMLLYFYDFDSYSVGNNRSSVFRLSIPSDIYNLNTLQMVSAYENVYFENKDFDIESLDRKANSFRRDQKSSMNVFPGQETEETKSEFIASSKQDVRINLKLSFSRITKGARKWRTKFQKKQLQPAVVVRNKELCDDHKEFLDKVDTGEYNPGEFFKFMEIKHEKS